MNHLGRRGREVDFRVAPLIVFLYSRILNEFNGVNTVFLNYKLCSFYTITLIVDYLNPYCRNDE